LWRIDIGKAPVIAPPGVMVSWLEKLRQERAEQSERNSDP